ncbi:MAG: histidinol dehydrogenase [Gammaproteobacteria bacterium]|nr:MAG: histidinol dehydrogenase [Gammaproteobacteria bacterium]RLA14971.1 MAG: histidinol dehydrogenase [Gammaproteobacteria bacterium]
MGLARLLATTAAEFESEIAGLLAKRGAGDEQALLVAAKVIKAVEGEGDRALLAYTAEFDQFDVADVAMLRVAPERIEQALAMLEPAIVSALERAAERLREYHRHQLAESWQFTDSLGNQLGQQVTSLQRVGVYVPGGKAAYPSTVLMNVIPAKVAGVEKIIMTSPTPGGELNDTVLAAAAIAGVDELFCLGGAQAVAALALGTQTVSAVDKIVGPGNRYVAAAKQLLYGRVGIDMLAGPSEILIIADASANPDWVAMDLFSQAEHDEMAQAILLSPDSSVIDAVAAAITRLLPTMPRQKIIAAALRDHGALIHVADMAEAVDLANRIAPEHLELAVQDPESLMPKIRNAGAIFVGHYSCEAVGDYCAGPNHVLPTSSTARFSSPLGVYDFQKRTSVIRCTQQGAAELGKIAGLLADAEGLPGHAAAARYRISSNH